MPNCMVLASKRGIIGKGRACAKRGEEPRWREGAKPGHEEAEAGRESLRRRRGRSEGKWRRGCEDGGAKSTFILAGCGESCSVKFALLGGWRCARGGC